METPMPEFIDPRFRENKSKMLVFSHRKRAFWACFRENCVHNFGHKTMSTLVRESDKKLSLSSFVCSPAEGSWKG
jgi:hypothetical protein